MSHFVVNVPGAKPQPITGDPSRELTDEEALSIVKQTIGSAVEKMGRQIDQIAKVDAEHKVDIAMLEKSHGVTVNSQDRNWLTYPDTFPE